MDIVQGHIIDRWVQLKRNEFPTDLNPELIYDVIDTMHGLGGVCYKCMRDELIRYDYDTLLPEYDTKIGLREDLGESYGLDEKAIYYIVFPERKG